MTHSPLTHTGHRVLSDMSIVRLDFECGHYVGSFYTPDGFERARVCSLELAVAAAAVAGWVLAYDIEDVA